MTKNLLNFTDLTKPISEAHPVGINLRDDLGSQSLYYQIKETRNLARAAERQQLQGEAAAHQPDWNQVVDLGLTILTKHAKDIEIIAWVIEGLLRQHGFAGLRDGFRLAHELIEKYADIIYPLPDEDGDETRLAALTGLNGDGIEGSLIVPIAAVPIIISQNHGKLALWQYQRALDLEKIIDPEIRKKRIDDHAILLDEFKLAASDTATEFFPQLYTEIKACQQQILQLYTLLEERYGEHSPPSHYIRQAIENFADHLLLLTDGGAKLESMESVELPVTAGQPQALADKYQHSSHADITTRHEALSMLLKIADYFEKTEPHSPLPYVIRRAVKWGNLPLPALLKELIDSEGGRDHVGKLTGIEF